MEVLLRGFLCVLFSTDISKMIHLQTNRLVLKWLCIQPMDEGESPWKRFYHAIFTFIQLTMNVGMFATSVVFAWENIYIDLQVVLYALFQMACSFAVIYMWIVAFLLRGKIAAFLGTLSEVYDARKHWI